MSDRPGRKYAYEVIEATTLDVVSERVTDRLQMGWKTAGGVMYTGRGYLQAVTNDWEMIV
jgi:hypothetical protein